jgi:hypothetical protein
MATLLLRVGERSALRGIEDRLPTRADAMRVLSARRYDKQGQLLDYAPYSHRQTSVDSWIGHCSSVLDSRGARIRMAEREKWYAALGYFTLLVLRRWRKWASCSAAAKAALYAVLLRRSMVAALRKWMRTCRLMQLAAGLVIVTKSSAVRRWRQLVQWQRACEHADAVLLQRCWRGWVELWLSRARLKVGMKGHAMLRMVSDQHATLI